MVECRTCGRSWPDALLNCPEDGTSLRPTAVIAAPEDDTAVVEGFAFPGPGILEPGTRAGDFIIEEVLGEGGMATVYAASHALIGKRAAVKVLSNRYIYDEAAVHRFVREARAVNEISHPNVVDIFDFGQMSDGRCFLAMERLEGRTLAQVLGTGPLPLPAVLHVTHQICDALEAAHQHGIVHRDLKPGNVFLLGDAPQTAAVKLLDFGIARVVDAAGEEDSVTRTGQLVGTPAYVAPEQVDSKPATAKSDVFSLGILIFEALTGARPYTGSGTMELLLARVQNEAPRLSSVWAECPAPLDAWIARMLERNPDRRPDIGEVRRALAQLADDRSTPTVESARPAKPARRRWPAIAASTLLACGLAALAFWAYDETRAGPAATAATEPVAEGVPEHEPEQVPKPQPETKLPETSAVAADARDTDPPAVAGAQTPRDEGAPNEEARASARRPREPRGSARRRQASPAVAARPAFGALTVNARPWVRVRVGGGAAKETPVRALRLSAGSHTLHFSNEDAAFETTRRVQLRKDETLEVFVDVPKKRVSIERR